MSHYSLDFSNLAEFDALAQSVAARLGCQLSLISVVRGDVLFALGHSSAEDGGSNRANPARNTVCARTVEAGVPLQFNDVRSDPELSAIPAVEAFNIGAYLGVPIKIDSGATVGAICALSTSPRIWRASEMEYLQAVVDLAESKIERHILRFEQQALSSALAENDAILSTLSQMHDKPMTVHNVDGELVFANMAMDIDLRLDDQDMLALPGVISRLRREQRRIGKVDVMLPAPTCTELKVQLTEAPNGLILAEWTCGKAR